MGLPIPKRFCPEPFSPNRIATAKGGTRCSRTLMSMKAQSAPAFQGCEKPLERQIKLVGMGSCGVDYLASVAAYPRPDEKLRTEKLETQGGGNCANALTAAARLGLLPTLVSKIGGDGLGDGIISELLRDGIDSSLLLRAAGHPSPFTYIIVDRAGGTRTCIHTPGAPLEPHEVTPQLLAGALEGAALVYFDGRLTEAAILLAKEARRRGVPVLVEAERLRPSLERLLALADYVVTSAHFPQDWTGEADLSDALIATAERLPAARWLITTLGTRGAVLLERPPSGTTSPRVALERTLDAVLSQELRPQLKAAVNAKRAEGEVVCVSKSGVLIGPGEVVATEGFIRLTYTSCRDPNQATRQAQAAAERAAALNADAGRGDSYQVSGTGGADTAGVIARVTFASIAHMPKICSTWDDRAPEYTPLGLRRGYIRQPVLLTEAVVDTTGAGDAFIGSMLYGICCAMSLPAMMRLAAVVAACKCTELGARPGLPNRSQLSNALLGTAF